MTADGGARPSQDLPAPPVPTSAAAAAPSPKSGFRYGMRAFTHPNYRRFWIGAFVSNSGTWLQNLAVPFVLVEITNQATWAGAAAFFSLFPAMLLGPLAGNLADRFDRRKILMIGQSAAALTSLLLWALWESGVREPAVIVAVAALGGVIGGFTIPAWQSFVPLLVPTEDLPSAISLNSLQFNAARAVGPAAGGAFIAFVGPSWTFLVNGLSYGAVLIALLVVNPGQTRQERVERKVFKGFAESLRYIRTQPGIMMGILSATVVAFLGYPVITFVVVFAKQVYAVEPWAVGLLSGLLGIGAILAVPVVSGVFGDLSRASVIKFAIPVYGLAIIIFGTSTSAPQGAAGLLIAGGAFLSIVSTSNTAVQSIVAERIRGRVMATRIMFFTGGFPLGALAQTAISDATSPRIVVTTAGALVLLIGFYLATKADWLAALDDPPDI